jgi:hypothetical protein
MAAVVAEAAALMSSQRKAVAGNEAIMVAALAVAVGASAAAASDAGAEDKSGSTTSADGAAVDISGSLSGAAVKALLIMDGANTDTINLHAPLQDDRELYYLFELSRVGLHRPRPGPARWRLSRKQTISALYQCCGSPTVSAIFAPREPKGFGLPVVVSRAVWCSVSALSSAPISTTIVRSQIQNINAMMAPREQYVLL